MEFAQISSSKQWHEWFAARRRQLQWRLEQAQHAEWNWPSTRARCEVHRIQDEIEQLDAEEFIVPGFAQDMQDALESCALEGARL